MTELKIVKTILIRAPRERVWAFLTEKDLLARWFHEGAMDLSAGQPFELVRENPVTDDPRMLWGDVLEADKPTRLVHTFRYHGQTDELKSTVEWTLEELSGGTKLTLVHTCSNASEAELWDEARGTDSGWDEHLTRLRCVFN